MSRPDRVTLLMGIALAVLVIVSALALYRPGLSSPAGNGPPPPPPPPPNQSPCPRSAGLCEYRTVSRVIDGDTLEVEGGLRIRLVLVDAPEQNETGGPEAKDLLTDLCFGVRALIDEDDFQLGGDAYGRTLAVVHCAGTNANAALIAGPADTYYEYCDDSEFGGESWSGCSSPPPPPPPPGDCDPAYPDVCIPSPPPDLDCADITHRNFRVLAPDPHHFDGDGDGIGCEG